MKVYTYDEAHSASLEYFDGDTFACETYLSKYALRDKDGNILEPTPSYLHRRLAREFARIEAKYPNPMSESEIFNLLSENDKGFGAVVPQGSPMSGIGNPDKFQSLSNCFVIQSPYDSYGGIMKTDQEEAQIMKRRGGVGFDISTIRPRGMATTNAARTTGGLALFMERYSNTCREVGQDGRRGALLLSIDIRHPQITSFINIKRDKKKVTGANISIKLNDEFMQAVESDSNYTLRWPVEASIEDAKVTKVVKARDIWEQIIDAAWYSAEPGVFFWDTVLKRTPSDIYKDEDFNSISTNPCFVYDTPVAVADGRGFVSIGKLAEEGLDIPVYSQDKKGRVVIRTMRNPRLTGNKVQVYKVTLEGGHSFRATGNHKFPLVNGQEVCVNDLKEGDQLVIAKKVERRLVELNPAVRTKNFNRYITIENNVRKKAEHRLIWESSNGLIPAGHVIHHIDFNSKNNCLSNLKMMSNKEHQELHSKLMLGDKNPMRRAKTEWSKEKWQSYHDNLSAAEKGLNNGNAYSEVSNEDLFKHAVKLSKELGHRFSSWAWDKYATVNNLPRYLVDFRFENYSSWDDWANKAAIEAGVDKDILCYDPRMQKSINEARNMGYETRIENSILKINRTCEECKKLFWMVFNRREIAFCSKSCCVNYVNKTTDVKKRRIASLRATYGAIGEKNKNKQLDIFTKLRFELGRNPTTDEWADSCKAADITCRLGTKFGFKKWNELKEAAALHNHRVLNIELDGYEDVYNGTVDEFHNFYIGGWQEENNEQLLILTKNCGEIVLSAYCSCRLMVLNLQKFIKNPFTEAAIFDFDEFNKVAQKAQRLMDGLVDLEIEAVDSIISKVMSDPEPEAIKMTELDLWRKIKDVAIKGRRTGLGITALGDTLAMLNMKYGSEQSVEMTEQIYKALALAAYRSSVNLAKERGSFPIFNLAKEKGHEFIEQIMDADPELRKQYELYGRRNIALTTTAPVGSVSVILQTTSGIEPAFMLEYKRRKKITGADVNLSVDFTDDLGDKWHEYTVYHHGVKQWIDTTGDTDIKNSPYWGALTADIDWTAGVRLQAAAQKWICHSISRTSNLPKSASHKTISEIYLEAWKNGCKGFTVYRDKSRAGVLLTGDDAKAWCDGILTEELEAMVCIGKKYSDDMPENYLKFLNDEVAKELKMRAGELDLRPEHIDTVHAPKRPKELSCDIHRVIVKGEPYTALVGLLEGKPYEIFCGLSEHFELPKKSQRGILVKNGKKDGVSTYNLKIPVDDDFMTFKDVVSIFSNELYGAFTRTVSLALRHGVPVNYICEQLNKDKHSDMQSFSKCTARVLKTYIPDGLKYVTSEKCPGCQAVNSLIYTEGCLGCTKCIYRKCG